MVNVEYLNLAVVPGLYGEGVPFDSGMTCAVKSHGAATGECVNVPRTEQVRRRQTNCTCLPAHTQLLVGYGEILHKPGVYCSTNNITVFTYIIPYK